MTSIEVIRFDLSELKEVALVCKKCGVKRTYPLDGETFTPEQECHLCKSPYAKGGESGMLFYHLQNLMKQVLDPKLNYRLEFELPAKK